MTVDGPAIDHLVYAAPRLAAGIRRIRELLGVEAEEGGRHARWGTHNALVGLGGRCYLEIIAPDPDAPGHAEPRPFGLDARGDAGLATWAVRTPDLEERVRRVRRSGVDPGPILEGSRELPDGRLLRWRLTDPAAERAGGIVPFFIDWGDSPHPGDELPGAATLVALRARHPDPGAMERILEGAGAPLVVGEGPRPALAAVVEGPAGRVELR